MGQFLTSNAIKTTVIQLARLGDLAQSWPLLARLRKESATCLVVNSGLAPFAALMADEVVPLNLKTLLSDQARSSGDLIQAADLREQLTAAACNRLINLNYHPGAAAIAESISAKVRQGPRWKDVIENRASDPQIEELFRASSGDRGAGRHLCDIWSDYVGPGMREMIPALNIEGVVHRQVLNRGERGLAAVIIGAGLTGRMLPVETWGRAVREIAGVLDAALIGTGAEEPLGRAIEASAKSPGRVINLAGKTDLEGLIEVLALSEFVIGVDTGALHLAAALGRPCVGVYYGSMGFRRTGPYGDGHIVLAPDSPGYPVAESAMRGLPPGAAPTSDCVAGLAGAAANKTTFRPPEGWGIWKSAVGEDGIKWEKAAD